ncbi:3-hydroxyacyl-CoA dehydrogenase family protein [Phytohabitans suffuscus]|uniref:3-hydroxybutyryl-CoA dehydrogenase n=1 Tax=Phytohabitans suffuscus TaxID=624315 RepID=A0A6F8Y9E2_9ACTN|nr:3-hydroxyacyl-CoA dehydrogenase family protein [Phytohabitans suffuscus]BCB82732.1 3-hydroxybutyryl-CoA dehydrogenase [Phytohabitans suffuscus]
MSAPESAEHRLTVLGAGVMGVSIAALASGHGIPVTLVDIDEAKLDRARTALPQQIRLAQLVGALPRDRVAGTLVTGTAVAAAAGSTAVVEAITENAEQKSKVLAEVAAVVPAGTPLITNTSAIPIAELAAAVPHPGLLIGTHFMNPAYVIRNVEVIRGPRTADSTVDAVAGLLSAVDRHPIVVRDAPGFVTSRLLHPMLNAAALVVQRGTATVEQVDALMQGCLGHATGPLRTADLIGLDNLVDSLNVLYEHTGDAGCQPCDLLLRKVRDGHLGRKSGRGFYEYGGAVA